MWAQDVRVDVDVLGSRLNEIVARSETLSGRKDAIRRSVEKLLEQAENAANGDNPIFLWVRSWWRGTLIEAAYQNLHAAEAEIVPLYDQFEVDAEFPEAVATVDASLNRDDPRRLTARSDIAAESLDVRRAKLRKLIETGHTANERQHTRLRSFRNIIVMTAILIGVLVLAFISAVAVDPASVPLCFKPPPGTFVCPAGRPEPSAHDVVVVALLGFMGGALAAAVSIRNLKGTSTPYDVPVALALLKVTAGALTAIGAIIAIRGKFVPGLSDLDSQEQILAYALVFGDAQQLLTRLIDQRASDLMEAIPSKDLDSTRPMPTALPPALPATPAEPAQVIKQSQNGRSPTGSAVGG
ncbi:MAG TPA: hypothetical protein VII33_18990 [Nakamurella sp.]